MRTGARATDQGSAGRQGSGPRRQVPHSIIPCNPARGLRSPCRPEQTDWRSSPLKPPREGRGRILNLSLTRTSAPPSESALVVVGETRPHYCSPLMTLPTPARGCNGANPPQVFWAAFVSAHPRGGAGSKLERCGGVSVTLGSVAAGVRVSQCARVCAVPTWLRRLPMWGRPGSGKGPEATGWFAALVRGQNETGLENSEAVLLARD